jgi:uncharacterized membrane protein YfcA
MIIIVYLVIAFCSFLFIIVPITGGVVLNPLLSLIVDPHSAIGMSVFFFMVNSTTKSYIFRDKIMKRYIIDMLPISIIFTIIGSIMIGLIPDLFLYLVMLAMTVYFLYKKLERLFSRNRKTSVSRSFTGNLLASSASGFMQGAGLGGGGSLRKSYFLSNGLSLAEMHGTTAVLSMILGGVATLLRLGTDQVQIGELLPILYLYPLLVVATVLGRHAVLRLNERIADKVIVATFLQR